MDFYVRIDGRSCFQKAQGQKKPRCAPQFQKYIYIIGGSKLLIMILFYYNSRIDVRLQFHYKMVTGPVQASIRSM